MHNLVFRLLSNADSYHLYLVSKHFIVTKEDPMPQNSHYLFLPQLLETTALFYVSMYFTCSQYLTRSDSYTV